MEWFIVVPLYVLGYITVGGICAFFEVRHSFNELMKENKNALKEYGYYYEDEDRSNSKERQIQLNLEEASKDWGAWLPLWPIGLLEILFKGVGTGIKHGVAGKAIKEAKAEAETKRLDALAEKYRKQEKERFERELEGEQ